MSNFTYGLYPFTWDAAAKCHTPPAGSACVLDLRPLGEQAKQSQSGGYGLFAWPMDASPPVSPPSDMIVLCVGYAPQSPIDNAARNELRIKLGLSANPAGATLAEALADVLCANADPTGAGMAKPIMPDRDGMIVLHLANHSPIWSRPLDVAELLSASPKGHANRIRDVIRADLDIAEAIGGAPLLQKALGAVLLKCGVSREELKAGTSGRKAQYDRLMSAAVKAKHGANAKPARPTTSASEAWPNVAADVTATAQSQSWESLQYTLSVNSGSTGFARAAGANFATHAVRCTTAVSSADHWANLAVYSFTQAGFAGPMARVATGAFTGYAHVVTWGGARYLAKWVGGARTDLGAVGSGAWSDGDLPTAYPNGSTITGSWLGKSDLTATDTAITGNLCGGIVFNDDTNAHTYNKVGAWSLDDGLNPPVSAFSGTPLSGLAPLSVAFTDASTNTPTSWLWERSSDGGSNWSTFSTSQNPTAEFTAGTWAVRLTATNAGGSDAETKLAYVVVTAPNRKALAGSYGLGMYRGLGL